MKVPKLNGAVRSVEPSKIIAICDLNNHKLNYFKKLLMSINRNHIKNQKFKNI